MSSFFEALKRAAVALETLEWQYRAISWIYTTLKRTTQPVKTSISIAIECTLSPIAPLNLLP